MTTDLALHVDIPAAYHELPLHHIDTTLAACQATLTDVLPSSRTELAHTVTVLSVLLNALAGHQTRYCGIARHHNPDGRANTSWLTVSLLTASEPANPRLTLLDCASAMLTDTSTTRVEPITLASGPVLLTERLHHRPPGATAIAQLEALVPAADASHIAAIAISTNSVAHTDAYRQILCATAASIRFTASAPPDWSLAL